MPTADQTTKQNVKTNVIQNAQQLLEKAELWTLMRTDAKGQVHVHAETQVDFLALLLCIFKEHPELKEDLDMMIKLEAHQTKLAKQ